MTWLQLLPVAALTAVLLLVPGALCLRLLGVRGVLAVGAAPAASAGVLGLGTIVLSAVGVPWRPWSVVLWLAAAVGAVAILRPRTGGGLSLPRTGRWSTAGLAAGMVVGLAVQVVPFVRGTGAPDAVTQMHDSLFHLNGAALIDRTGNASPFGGLAAMYGDGGSGFYPSLWHALVVLGLPVAPVEVATNAAVVVAVTGSWLLGILALARVAAPGRPAVAASAVVLAGSFPVFPTISVVFKGMYPFGLSVALTPGAVALVVIALQQVGAGRSPRLFGALLACGGVVLAHPSGAAALVLLCAPVLVQQAWRRGADLRARGRPVGAVAVAAVPWLMFATLALAVHRVPVLQQMADFSSPSKDRLTALLQALLTVRTGEVPLTVNVVVAVLIGIGFVTGAATSRTRWLSGCWLLALSAYVITAGPEGPLRTFAGFWYKSPDRVESLLVTVSAVVAACGAVAVASAVAAGLRWSFSRLLRPGRVPAVMVTALVLILAVSFVTSGAYRHAQRELRAARAYDTARMIHPPWASEEELDWIRELGDVLPEDAVVLGDPRNGAAFVQALAGRRAAVPALGGSVPSEAARYLLAHFRDIRTDAAVCAALDAEGIEYYYADGDMVYGSGPVSDARPGLYGVDTSEGFELLSENGTSRLYRITACE